MDFLIDGHFDGMSVLDFLRREVQLTGAMLRHLKFADDGITVNGKHVTVRHRLCEGELLSIKAEDEDPSPSIAPCDIELPIAYEDTELVVPNKPPFMPTHPSHGHYDDTVANALAFRYQKMGVPFVFRPVNRLDRNTSGLVLIARNRMSAASLSNAMRNGEVHKEYVAILEGALPNDRSSIETYMKRTEQSVIVRRVCEKDEGGDYALTKYRVIFQNGSHSVILASPVTGRTHQLRVHFSHLGCPIVGDDMYGKESEYIDRHALHAVRLRFPHPESAEITDVKTSPLLPSDMDALLKKLFTAEEREKIEKTLTHICDQNPDEE